MDPIPGQRIDDLRPVPPLPGWIGTGAQSGRVEDAAFRAGAALAHLALAASQPQVPQALWRARLALGAAEICTGHSGRPEAAGPLRDTLAFLRPGDAPGPGGEILRHWRAAVAGPLRPAALRPLLATLDEGVVAQALARGQHGNAVQQAAAALGAVLLDRPRRTVPALILADAVLSRGLGLDRLLPLLGAGLGPRDLMRPEEDLHLACHRAILRAAGPALGLAADLERRAARLRAVAPKLRARGAEQAVALFLTHDALPPAALTGIMSDRAARRFWALREMSGRDSFRLYGL